MNIFRLCLIHLLISVAIGLTLSLSLKPNHPVAQMPEAPNTLPFPLTAPLPDPTPAIDLENASPQPPTLSREQRTRLNGRRLPLDYEGVEEDHLPLIKVIHLSSGNLLVGLKDTLYLLNSKHQIKWRYTPSWILFDFDVVESTGLVYGSAGDNVMFIIDLSSGKKLYSEGRNGSAAFGQVKAYGKDQCLILDNNAGYRDRLSDPTLEDGIAAWRGTELLWWREFPPDAELAISGRRIYAVTKTGTGIYRKEVVIPKNKRE